MRPKLSMRTVAPLTAGTFEGPPAYAATGRASEIAAARAAIERRVAGSLKYKWPPEKTAELIVVEPRENDAFDVTRRMPIRGPLTSRGFFGRAVARLKLLRRARRRIPARRVRQLLEIRRGQVRTAGVDRVVDLRGHREPAIAVGHRVEIVILGDRCLRAVRRAVLAHVARTQIRRHDFEIPGTGRPSRGRRVLPFGDRLPLPGRLSRRGRGAECEQTRLGSGVCLEPERVV